MGYSLQEYGELCIKWGFSWEQDRHDGWGAPSWPTRIQSWPMTLHEPVHVFQVLSNGPPCLCPPLLPCWPFPGLSYQASCYKSGREQTRDPGDMGDAEESLQDCQPTQRLWEASVFRGRRPKTLSLHCLWPHHCWVLFLLWHLQLEMEEKLPWRTPKISSPCVWRRSGVVRISAPTSLEPWYIFIVELLFLFCLYPN